MRGFFAGFWTLRRPHEQPPTTPPIRPAPARSSPPLAPGMSFDPLHWHNLCPASWHGLCLASWHEFFPYIPAQSSPQF
jgi:hypothetical protein